MELRTACKQEHQCLAILIFPPINIKQNIGIVMPFYIFVTKKKKDSKKKSDATDNLIGELNCFVEMYDSRGYCVIIIIRTVLWINLNNLEAVKGQP